MNKKIIALVVGVALLAGVCSHVLLSNIIGGEKTVTSAYRLQFTDQENVVKIENAQHLLSDVRTTGENTVEFVIEAQEKESLPGAGSTASGKPSSSEEEIEPSLRVSITQAAYDLARESNGTIILLHESKHEKTLWPISTSLGIAASLVFAAVWLSRREAMGSATSMLLDEGLESMSIRDAEIVGEAMRRKEFTIPELMEKAGTSKITTWRTVKKLVKKGLVRETERTRAPSRGLGGRGKPSKVYEYVESD